MFPREGCGGEPDVRGRPHSAAALGITRHAWGGLFKEQGSIETSPAERTINKYIFLRAPVCAKHHGAHFASPKKGESSTGAAIHNATLSRSADATMAVLMVGHSAGEVGRGKVWGAVETAWVAVSSGLISGSDGGGGESDGR